MISAARCEIGNLRKINQDKIFVYNTQFGCLPNLYIVADGMGGHKSGEVASASAVQFFTHYIHEQRHMGALPDYDLPDILTSGVSFANKALYDFSFTSDDYNGMGTTLLCACIQNNRIFAVNVGDSRLYIVNKGGIRQKTHDHSYVMELVKIGSISKEEAEQHPKKNYLTRSVGTSDTVEIDAFVWNIGREDYVLMCSDGLSNMIPEYFIQEIVAGYGTLEEKVQALVDTANNNGGIDNISAILIHI